MKRIDEKPEGFADRYARESARLDKKYGPVIGNRYRVVEYVDSYTDSDDVWHPARGVVAGTNQWFDTEAEAWEEAKNYKPSKDRGEIRVERLIVREKFVPAHFEHHKSTVVLHTPTKKE